MYIDILFIICYTIYKEKEKRMLKRSRNSDVVLILYKYFSNKQKGCMLYDKY